MNNLVTESRNVSSSEIDTLSTLQMLEIINAEDQKVAIAVKNQLPQIASAVDIISQAFSQQGRLIYLGAGTSGRLGILDASECPPTYGTKAEQVQAFIAGGQQAILQAVENAEDNALIAARELKAISLTSKDVVVGIAASGRTPYVIGGMQYAKAVQAKVVSITCNPNNPMSQLADIAITPVVGAEVITGSSRMKAGTAQKLILNMLTTTSMIKTGKVFGNLMIDVQASNAKLRQRQLHIVMEATGASQEEAKQALSLASNHCKTAILMLLADINVKEAQSRLAKHQGFIRNALKNT